MVAGELDRCRVRVWFGPHMIAVYAADPELAAYLAVMRGHFTGLQVTIDEDLTGVERPLPAARLWDAVAP